MVTLILMLLLIMPECLARQLDLQTCVPVGLAMDDNDIRLERVPRRPGRAAALPKMVVERVQATTARMLARTSPELVEGAACHNLLGPVYRVRLPGEVDLYVAEMHLPSLAGLGYHFLILHDRARGQVTREPPWIGSKWPNLFGIQDQLVRRPLVSSAKLFSGGQRQVLFAERVHNGNVYNGIVYHYFEIGPEMTLTRVLALETRVLDIFRDKTVYVREVTPIGTNRLRLDLYEGRFPLGTGRKMLGHSILERAASGKGFRVVERHPLPGVEADMLVTFCPTAESEDIFLRDGCDHYY